MSKSTSNIQHSVYDPSVAKIAEMCFALPSGIGTYPVYLINNADAFDVTDVYVKQTFTTYLRSTIRAIHINHLTNLYNSVGVRYSIGKLDDHLKNGLLNIIAQSKSEHVEIHASNKNYVQRPIQTMDIPEKLQLLTVLLSGFSREQNIEYINDLINKYTDIVSDAFILALSGNSIGLAIFKTAGSYLLPQDEKTIQLIEHFSSEFDSMVQSNNISYDDLLKIEPNILSSLLLSKSSEAEYVQGIKTLIA